MEMEQKAAAAATKADEKRGREKTKTAAAAQAAAAAARTEWQRLDDISSRVRRSKYWCDCGCPVHKERCLIWGSYGEVMWLGADTDVSREKLAWYYSKGGRVQKGTHFI